MALLEPLRLKLVQYTTEEMEKKNFSVLLKQYTVKKI